MNKYTLIMLAGLLLTGSTCYGFFYQLDDDYAICSAG